MEVLVNLIQGVVEGLSIQGRKSAGITFTKIQYTENKYLEIIMNKRLLYIKHLKVKCQNAMIISCNAEGLCEEVGIRAAANCLDTYSYHCH